MEDESGHLIDEDEDSLTATGQIINEEENDEDLVEDEEEEALIQDDEEEMENILEDEEDEDEETGLINEEGMEEDEDLLIEEIDDEEVMEEQDPIGHAVEDELLMDDVEEDEEDEDELINEDDDVVGAVEGTTADELLEEPYSTEEYEDDLLVNDGDSLYEPHYGFDDVANIKKILTGYSDSDQNAFFPLIDEQSGVLFEIVQELESAQLKSSENILSAYKTPVAIPSCRLSIGEGGPEIKLKILDPTSREEAIIKRAVAMASSSPEKLPDRLLAAIAKDAFPPDKLALLLLPLEKGWKREIVMRSHGGASNKKLGDVYYFSPDGIKFRSSKQVALFLSKNPELGMTIDNFTFAKARVSYDPEQETVRQAHGGRGSVSPVKQPTRPVPKAQNFDTEDAYGQAESELSRNGIETDFSVEEGDNNKAATVVRGGRRSIQPPKRYATGETAFHSEKRPKMSKQIQQEREFEDNYGGMEMGMLPPKYPRGMEDSNNQTSILSGEEQYADFKRRGRPPKPGGKKDLMAQAEAIKAAKSAAGTFHAEEDGALFGISAFNQTGHFGHYSEGMGMNYGQYTNEEDMSYAEGTGKLKKHGNNQAVDDGLSRDTEELLPCSIRCPGMTGEIPTLQCRRCLCLYHPHCLGLPAQNYRNFFCANCEGGTAETTRQTAAAAASESRQQQQNKQIKMIGEMCKGEGRRSSPPPLIQLSKTGGFGRITKMGMQPPLRKLLPKMPSLQPPGSGNFGRIGPIRMKSRIVGLPRLNPPHLRMLKKPETGDGTGSGGVSVSSIDMRRGRGRPPRNLLIPQLNNRSLTITPISIPRKGMQQAPVVPRLPPMMTSRGGGMMGRGPHLHPHHHHHPNPGIRAVRPTLKAPQSSLMHRSQFISPMQQSASGRITFSSGTSFKPPTQSNNFKRYAQSVVTMNQRKYIVLPKSKQSSKQSDEPPPPNTTTSTTTTTTTNTNTNDQYQLNKSRQPSPPGAGAVAEEDNSPSSLLPPTNDQYQLNQNNCVK